MGGEITLAMAFALGVVSFLSPCVLPILPAYLSLISGLSYEELTEADTVRKARGRLFGSALAFVLGFGVVMVLAFGSLTALMSEMNDGWKLAFRIVGFVVILIFALHMFGLFRIKALFKEYRFHLGGNKLGYVGAGLAGAAFGFGWTPCLGPIVFAVSAMAVNSQQHEQAWWLLAVYAVGMAVPFLLTALFVDFFLGSMRKITRHLRTVEVVSGVLLLIMGGLLITDKLTLLNQNPLINKYLGAFSTQLEERIITPKE